MWKIVIKCENCKSIDSWKGEGLCKKCGCKVAYPAFFRDEATPTRYGELISAKRKYKFFGKWIESGFKFQPQKCCCNNCS
ncbi:hypothetical protein HYH39_06285 [Clostridium botulinum]|nr:hypothetical protein KU40_05070 [Clostridium botulinum]MBY6778551.1 hypothetical protein [Clostridium botulinum]MBY6851730.1 hypothetical protein [Clostridium botulinum]NFF21820.1 hypothetical protein [Clostridium botulinum]NFF37410.1 hypothetical protein [Clostridium botulinum]